MPSFSDSILIFILALLLFGPKKLPVLARELGKWIGEFRRASNEFKMQMEEELRISEQADRQKEIAAIEAAAPVAPALDGVPTEDPPHPHLPAAEQPLEDTPAYPEEAVSPAPLPIATSGDLSIMPPATGLPIAQTRGDISPLLDSIPAIESHEVPDPPQRHTHYNTETAESATNVR